jgi:hypothetical protein
VQPAQAQAPPILAPEPAALVSTYRLTYRPDSTNPAARSEIMCLLLGKTRSQFESRNNQLDDSLLAEAEKLPFNQENLNLFAQQLSLLPHSHFRYTIYKITAPQHVY